MNRYIKGSLFLAALAATAATHGATTSTTVAVSGTVPVQCSVSATALSFGTISATAQTIQNGSVSVTCPNGVPYTVAMNGGQNQASPTTTRRMTNGSGGFVVYSVKRGPSITGAPWGDTGFGDTLTAQPVTGTGSGSAQTLPFTGGTDAGSYPAGSYSDLITVTVHF